MATHFTTFVLPASIAAGLPDDTPFLVLGADTAEEISALPLVTSLHVTGNVVWSFVHLAKVPADAVVGDEWIAAVERYENAAKVVVVREPVPLDITTEYAEVTQGVRGDDLPPWVGPLLVGKLHAASREVPVTKGEDPLTIGIDPSAPTTYPAWAHQVIEPT